MSAKLDGLLTRMKTLEGELEFELALEIENARRDFERRLEKGRIYFEARARLFHRRFRKSEFAFLKDAGVMSLLIAPVIYSLAVPLALLDAWIWVYQAVCFPVYGIEKVSRSRYISFDRGRLGYLNWVEGANCQYCAYANGLLAYAREVASRTEQYFCPIKHAARLLERHARYQRFVEYGDAEGFRGGLGKLREELKPAGEDREFGQRAA